ncbi:transmembrane sensor [Pseudomonas sp. TE3786]
MNAEQPRLSPAVKAAIDWMVFLDSGRAHPADQHAFSAWLAADGEHRRAWESVAGALRTPFQQLADAQRQLPGSVQATAQVLRGSGISQERRRLLRGGATLLLLAGLPSVLTLQRRMPLEGLLSDFYSATGERKQVPLADGSLLSLNARSTANLLFSREIRQISLQQGELSLQAVADPQRPFEVLTAQGRISTLGARFVVRQLPGQTLVSVQENSVQVVDQRGRSGLVSSGQTLRWSADQAFSVVASRAREDAWLDGLLDVDDESLGAVIDALRPYRYGLLRVSPAAARLRVFGVFPLDDSDRTLQSLAQVLPISVEQYGPVTLVDLA